VRRQVTHLGCIVLEAVRPNQIEVVFKFLLGLVLFLLDLLQHRLEVHRVRYVWCAVVDIRATSGISNQRMRTVIVIWDIRPGYRLNEGVGIVVILDK
jgi:hypothetical protein